jgi:hypothetical protein
MSPDRYFNYTLTPTRLNNAKPKERAYRLAGGGGLFAFIQPDGFKTWAFRCRVATACRGGIAGTENMHKSD